MAGRFELGRIATAAALALAALQFVQFWVAFVSGVDLHRQNSVGYAQRVVFETVIARVHHRPVPAMYLVNLGPFAELYWKFYGLKHERADLGSHVVVDDILAPERFSQLPPGSIAIVGSADPADPAVAQMRRSERVTADLIGGHGSEPAFWVLERAGP